MAKSKSASTVRLIHANGATVTVAADSAARFISTGVFAAEPTKAAPKSDSQ